MVSKQYFESEGTQYYVKGRNPLTGEIEQRKVDSYNDFRNGDAFRYHHSSGTNVWSD
jgi:hypothetical protein